MKKREVKRGLSAPITRRRALQLGAIGVGAGLAGGLPKIAQAEPMTIAKIKEMGALRIGVEATYPPFTFREGGKIVGYDADLIEIFTKSLGVKADIIDTQWSGVIPSLYAERFEMIMSGMSYTKERMERVAFSIPYADASQSLLIRAEDAANIKTIDDMEGRVIGVKIGSVGETLYKDLDKEMKEKGGQGFSGARNYDEHPVAYLALSQGTVDGVLNTLPTLAKVKQDRPGHYEIVQNISTRNYAGIAMRKDDIEIKQFIDSEILRIKRDGTLSKIQEKWFGITFDLPDQIPQF